jgi:hypothetical protein
LPTDIHTEERAIEIEIEREREKTRGMVREREGKYESEGTRENDIEGEPDSKVRKRKKGYSGKYPPAIASRFLGNMREGPA